jgi:regulator of replication initiation timing
MPKTKITNKELFETLDRLEQESIEAKAELKSLQQRIKEIREAGAKQIARRKLEHP